MKKITDFIVEKRYYILVLFLILTGICFFLSTKVNINTDITRYLPADSTTRIGKDIMDKDFDEQKSSYLNVMFKNLDNKKEVLEDLKKIDGVDSVDYDSTEDYNKDEYTLFKVNVKDYDHSTTSKEVYETIKEDFDVEAFSGSIYDENKPVLQISIVIIAISMAMVILIILSNSYFEPFLYLAAIGIAVFLNKGTNIMFDNVSNITDSITAILQLALSMDYSIMLSNRYRQEKESKKSNIEAMKEALYQSFKSISSSSVTTVVGLLALVFMSFTIGKDLGFVLAKGVLLSLVSIFFCLPALLLLFDKVIAKTKKKEPHFKLDNLGAFSFKTKYIQLILIIIVFVVSYFLKGNLGILYTGSEQDEVGKVFPANNQIAIIYENKYEKELAKYCKKQEKNDKVDQVLCYGNTIGEPLSYDELNDKLKELGQDTEIDDYIIKLVYYNYYNESDNSKMSVYEFVKFIKDNVYTNEKLSSSISDSSKVNIDKLELFSNKVEINKKRTSKEIADILDIKESDVSKIFVLYNSKNNSTKLSIKEFVDFMNKYVVNDPDYNGDINKSTKESLRQLATFTNKDIYNKPMTPKEISNLFGIEESLVEKLFTFNKTLNDTSKKMTINEFATFTLNNVVTNEDYKSLFNDDTINLLKTLQTLSNNSLMNKELSSKEMTSIFSSYGINESMMNDLYLFYATQNESNSKLTLNEFATLTLTLSNNPTYSSYFTEDNKNSLNSLKTLTEVYNVEMDATHLNSIFGLPVEQINGILSQLGVSTMTPQNFNNVLLTNDQTNPQLLKLKTIMDNTNNAFTYQEIASFTGLNSNITKTIYSVNDYNKGLIKLSPSNLVNLIITNKENLLLKDKVSSFIPKLELAKNIIDNSTKEFTYKELSILIGIDSNTLKNIYILSENNNNKLTPYQFVNLILNNKDNSLLKGKIDSSTITKLNILNKAMNSTNNNTKYNSKDISSILGIDKESTKLIYGLYYTKNNKTTISLINFTNFMNKNVVNDKKYNKTLTKDSINKLNSVNSIMNNSIKGSKYNSKEMYTILSKLSNDLDSNLVDVVYIYNGSKVSYDKKWKMTIEEFINYLNDTMINDSRFEDVIKDDMKDKIINAKDSIDEAKNLLVTDKYSRAILNTKYASEGKETFEFIDNTLDEINNDGVYVIGDSSMAYEMKDSFNGELNFITILTIVFIFVVVAITFKSLIIPAILVLIIQSAVFLTMGILSLFGGNVYFIALLIVQAILMGATIDYAIVYTSYYKESRETLDIKESIINAYNKSIHTILTSSSILIVVTLIVANFASAIAAKICETLSQGTICSVIMIMCILPGVLAAFDKFICKNKAK